MIERPIWFEYVVWGYDEDNIPYIKGLRKDAPDDIKRQFKKDLKEMRDAYGSDEHVNII